MILGFDVHHLEDGAINIFFCLQLKIEGGKMIKGMYYSLKNLHGTYIVISIYQSCVTVTIVVGVTPCSLVEGS